MPMIQKKKKGSIHDRFIKFHEENPHVYKKLLNLAHIAKAAGRNKISMKLLFEKLRWDYIIDTKRPEGEFRLNNNFTSYYARMIMRRNPDLAGMFELRNQNERIPGGLF